MAIGNYKFGFYISYTCPCWYEDLSVCPVRTSRCVRYAP